MPSPGEIITVWDNPALDDLNAFSTRRNLLMGSVLPCVLENLGLVPDPFGSCPLCMWRGIVPINVSFHLSSPYVGSVTFCLETFIRNERLATIREPFGLIIKFEYSNISVSLLSKLLTTKISHAIDSEMARAYPERFGA